MYASPANRWENANTTGGFKSQAMTSRRSVRGFSGAVEAIARHWREHAVSPDDWRATTGKTGEAEGEAQGYFVTSGPLNAYAKPSAIDPGPNAPPRAAHEKIASDLAFDLGLPLPPAILHSWKGKPAAGNQPFVVLSLIPFLAAHKWRVVRAIPDVELQLRQQLIGAASAIVPFDTWLDNRDRPNDGNLLVSQADANPPGSLVAAYIDYAYCMTHGWRQGDYKVMTPVAIYPIDASAADKTIMDDVIKRIEELPDENIRKVVNRIPSDFLSESDRTHVVDGLLYRRQLLRNVLKPAYGANT